MLGLAQPVANGSAWGSLALGSFNRNGRLRNEILEDALGRIFQSRATRAGGSRVALVEPEVLGHEF